MLVIFRLGLSTRNQAGSWQLVTTCGYIVLQFFKLTPEESSKDPLYFVLARHQKRDVTEHRKGPSVVTARVIFVVLGCLMLGTLLYTLIVDGSPFRAELYTPHWSAVIWLSVIVFIFIGVSHWSAVIVWMAALLIDFYIHIAIIGAWVVYKESSWIMATVWVILLICLGSVTTCGYIVLQFFKLTPEESSKDPLYFVLARHQKRDVTEHRKGPSVVTARVIFVVLGCLMLGTLLYTLIVDGSPFRAELYTP
ncbi:hypothetical protein L6452_02509 [Arctium lappa]|uniref:Uncharacterized protein n=1 Tax=Arctium lappa TaxID=4217 RepID=A0ACB9FKI8_ARCLA|nr:hypothetical protein L6452_02509 [Arctium lappa]